MISKISSRVGATRIFVVRPSGLVITPTPTFTPTPTVTPFIPENDFTYVIIPNNDLTYTLIPNNDLVYMLIPNDDLTYTLIPSNDLTHTLIPNNDLEYTILNSEGFRYILTGAQPEEFAPPSQGYVILPDFENNVGSLNPNSLGPNDGLEVSFWINPIDGYGNNLYQFLSQFTNGDNPFRLTLCQNGDCVIYTGNTLVFVEEFGSFYFDSSQNTIELIQPSNGLFLNNVEVYVLFESINSVTPTPTETPTPTPTETSTPTPTPTSTPTPTATPEIASLEIQVPPGSRFIVFDGITYNSTTTINVVKNQMYSINTDNSISTFWYYSGNNINLPAPNSPNTIVYITGNAATLQVTFHQ